MKTILFTLIFALLSGCAVAHNHGYPYYDRYGYTSRYDEAYARYQRYLYENNRPLNGPFNGAPCIGIRDLVAYEWCKNNERAIMREQERRYLYGR